MLDMNKLLIVMNTLSEEHQWTPKEIHLSCHNNNNSFNPIKIKCEITINNPSVMQIKNASFTENWL